MTRVLAFGDDGSAEADRCWDWIASHRWDGWRLEIIRADPPADMHPVESEKAELHPWDPQSPRSAGGHGFANVEDLRAQVDPRLALISRPWDLVTIGPRGSGMLKTLHLGSTADWLIREPASPIVVARLPGRVSTVLVGADGSPHARSAIETLVSLPWLEDVSVRVVAVEDGRVDTAAAIEEATGLLSATGAAVEETIRPGKPTRVLMDEISASRPDLVVMGVRGHGGVKRLVVGSTAAAIAGSTDRSILVAHAVSEDDV